MGLLRRIHRQLFPRPPVPPPAPARLTAAGVGVIDICTDLERIDTLAPRPARKVPHATGAHRAFQNISLPTRRGFELRNAEVATLVAAVQATAAPPPGEFGARRQAAWEFARGHHTRSNLERVYRRLVAEEFQLPTAA